MVHSSASSLADGYYNYANDDLTPTETSAADAYYLQQRDHQLPQQSYSIPPPSTAVKKQASLAQIAVPSFSAFRSQASSIPVPSPRTAHRHPASFLASPRPTSFSAAEQPSPRLAEPASRPLSLDSPLPQQAKGLANVLTPPLTEDTVGRPEARFSYAQNFPSHDRGSSIDSRVVGEDPSASRRSSRRSSIPVLSKHAHKHHNSQASQDSTHSSESRAQESPVKGHSPRPSMISHQQTPSVNLQLEGVQRTLSDESLSTNTSEKRPKSPSRLGAFFGWKSSPQKSGTESPTTTFSDRSLSPAPSPLLHKPMPMDHHGARLTPPGLDIHKANSQGLNHYDNPSTPIMLNSPEGNAHVQELEKELEHISSELAGSIRREMELEDELERLKLEVPPVPAFEEGRRSSDYFSDSGASSSRYPVSDVDGRIEEVERLRRKAEQEKAQMQSEHSQRLHTEMTKRRELEQLVHGLQEQVQDKSDAEDERIYYEEKLGELETALDEARRRLGQEKKAKDNFEDLYSATREELEQRRNERDNLRDEILPQLKSRVEGLEAQATESQALVYENTRMQQELYAMKEEQKAFFEMQRMNQAPLSGFSSIAEEDDYGVASPAMGPKAGLSRSGSLARSSSKRGGSLTRSNSVKERESSKPRSGSFSGTPTPEAQREVEDQRDALHKALKLLISRYERQQKDHERAMKRIASERTVFERRVASRNPKQGQYSREVSFLKQEVSTLRKRTEDALEQKWEYEKGLSGIKMDLDRAEEETRGLRILLHEHDILAPSPRALLNSQDGSVQSQDHVLQISISTAEAERDQARQAAESYRQRALEMQEASSAESDSPSPAVAKLFDSANRMDELAEQLEQQVNTNTDLRLRLATAVEKGEQEQRQSTQQIEDMQSRLAGLEDSVLAAQQHSETTLSSHETEVLRLEEATSPSLQRLHVTIPEPSKLSPVSPLFKKSPRLGSKLSETSLLELSKTQMLERKVRELEKMLREAENDMQAVVQRVNRSQFEVAELTGERDAALIQMRKLQNLIVEEKEKADGLL